MVTREGTSVERLDELRGQRLARLLSLVQRHPESFYGRKFAECSTEAVQSVEQLARLPLTTRDELEADQRDNPPYGTHLLGEPREFVRFHQTSGSSGRPLVWLDTAESWQWWKTCWQWIFKSAGVGAGSRVYFPFSFGPFIGFWSAFEAAADLGCRVMPGGGMTSAARLAQIVEHRVEVLCCTPTYGLRLAEVARAEGLDLPASDVRALIVAGEPGGSIPATREQIENAWGARVFDHAGSTEAGPWGYESESQPGLLQLIREGFVAEVIDPDTREPALPGERGELVLTNLGRTGSPLIRYRTGDLVVSGERRGPLGCEEFPGGVLGRCDDMIVVRGVNLFPSAIEGIVRGFQEIAEFAIVVESGHARDELLLEIEPTHAAGAGRELAEGIEAAVRDRLHIRPVVHIVEPLSLPRAEMKARRLIRKEKGES